MIVWHQVLLRGFISPLLMIFIQPLFLLYLQAQNSIIILINATPLVKVWTKVAPNWLEVAAFAVVVENVVANMQAIVVGMPPGIQWVLGAMAASAKMKSHTHANKSGRDCTLPAWPLPRQLHCILPCNHQCWVCPCIHLNQATLQLQCTTPASVILYH